MSDGTRRVLVVLIPPLGWLPDPPGIVELAADLGAEERRVAASGRPAGRRRRRPPATETARELPPGARADFTAVMRRVEAAFLARQAAEERIRRFVADASHELRTPLTAIAGAADVLDRAREDPVAVARVAAVLHAQAARMGALVDDLLTLASLDAAAPPRREAVALDRLAAEHAEELRLAGPDRRIELRAAPGVTVAGDPEQLRRVLANLTGNAIRHGQPSGVVAVEVDAADGFARLAVRDDWPGIAPAQQPHVFERFWRGDPARSAGGSGLGLAIVREIAEAHGGRVALESTVGSGSTFRVELPLG